MRLIKNTDNTYTILDINKIQSDLVKNALTVTNPDKSKKEFYTIQYNSKIEECINVYGGAVMRVIKLAAEYAIHIEYVGFDDLPTNYNTNELHYPFKLYDLQQKMVDMQLALKIANNKQFPYGTASFDTNAGKTVVMGIVANAVYRLYPTLIVGHNPNGAVQIYSELYGYGANIRLIQGIALNNKKEYVLHIVEDNENKYISWKELYGDFIYVISVTKLPTLHNFYVNIGKKGTCPALTFGCILWDEADEITESRNKWIKEIIKYWDVKMLRGFTATMEERSPERQMYITEIVGQPLKLKVSYSQLVALGKSSIINVVGFVPSYKVLHKYEKENAVVIGRADALKYRIATATFDSTDSSYYDSNNHKFNISVLKSYGFNYRYINLVRFSNKIWQNLLNDTIEELVDFVLPIYEKHYSLGQKGMICVCPNSLEYLEKLGRAFRRKTDKSVLVVSSARGNMSLKNDFKEGKFDIILSTNITTGLSRKDVGVCVMLKGNKANAQNRQTSGRAERTTTQLGEIPDNSTIIDYDLRQCKLGFLTTHSKSRFDSFSEIGYIVKK